MLNSAATLEEDGLQVESEAAQPTRPDPTHPQGAGVMRFAYATGSRPLDGFSIKRGIGVGGFGEVYFAVSDAGKEVAIKRIQRSMDVEVRGASQCLNLKHQNLISLFDIKYDDEGQAWVVMEYVAGDSLKDVIEKNPNGMPEDQVLHWFRGIAHGVAYLHDHGIIHRDLKPGNIFVDHDVVKIGDYGLSKYISCSRRSGQTESVGTFHYMAPEIGKGVYGKEIDIYALGIMLCEMLSGTVPFDGESSQEIIMKHLTADPELGKVSGRYRPVIERALAKDPNKRFNDVQEMLAKVEAAYSGVTDVPPIRRAVPQEDVLYIADEVETDDGIYLGPVREVASASPATPENASSNGNTHRDGPREPIAAAVYGGARSLQRRWDNSHLSSGAKVLLIVGGIALLVLNSEWLLPAAAVLGLVYLPYLGIYHLSTAMRKPTPAPIAPAAAPRRPAPARERHRRVAWQKQARATLGERTLSERLGELNGSLLSAALVAGVMSLFMVLIGGMAVESVYTWSLFGWLSLTSVAGAWIILAISKLWEGGQGEQFRRRFVMLVGGLGLGLAAFAASEHLALRPTGELAVANLPDVQAWAGMYESDRHPKLPAFLVYFAGLFVVTRWWLQSDPLRATRLNVFSTAICVFWAWIVNLLWPFPQPWGLMLAATISVAVQMSAPWMTSSERSRIRSQVMEA